MRAIHPALLFPLAFGVLGCDPPTRPDAPPSQTGPIPTQGAPSAAGPATGQPPSPAPSGDTSPAPLPAVDPPPADAVAKLARSSNAFGFDLYQRLRAAAGADANLVISPSSITTALTMTWGGAKGETAKQMASVLRLEVTPEEAMATSGKLAASLQSPARPVTFRIANQLFGEKTYTYDEGFLTRTKEAYGASMERLDFAGAPEPARVHINQWVEQKTEKRIQDLIPPRGIDDQTRLVLVNAIYFLGDWEDPFEKDRTAPAPFFTKKDVSTDVPTMSHTSGFRIAQKDGVSALELPYKGGQMSMMLVVPDAVDGLAAVEKSLDAAKLDGLAKSMEPKRVWLQLPKFEVKPAASLELVDPLKAMGMAVAFDREKADFTGIANPPNPADRLFIGNVFHKGFIRVDEKGTEAAAATAVVMPRAGSAPAQPLELKVNRPFLFFLRDNASGLVLFMGRVIDPTKP